MPFVIMERTIQESKKVDCVTILENLFDSEKNAKEFVKDRYGYNIFSEEYAYQMFMDGPHMQGSYLGKAEGLAFGRNKYFYLHRVR